MEHNNIEILGEQTGISGKQFDQFLTLPAYKYL